MNAETCPARSVIEEINNQLFGKIKPFFHLPCLQMTQQPEKKKDTKASTKAKTKPQKRFEENIQS